jgi:maltose alpha-D-glucosyltransferase/alpha-amylase
LWYRDAVIYQLRVRSFCDSNDDGIGDFAGLTSKLDYLKDLGATALWLLPFYPSPLRDDGYDIADYADVHRDVGTLADFRRFLREARHRGLRVITELVMNHTSDQHPWFQRARRSPPGSRERDFYVWSDDTSLYREARIIFKDFEESNWAWDPVAQAYYWHRFYSHQPDLNFDNPTVRKEMFRALDFWFRMGVDGVRLDAIPYLYERDGTSCENLPETHAFLKELRAHVDENFEDRMLLAEANQWPEDAVQYFGDGDECHMAFHFPIMPRLYMALHMETRDPIIDILHQTPAIPSNCQWSIFLRNHDELTLEMVTDEERDYMWRAYAPDMRARINLGIRHRLAPLLRNDRRRMELMTALLLSLPGTPIVYYGDEIGMGDNIYLSDRDAVRTPMQWSPDRNAGFSRSNPQKLVLPIVSDPEYSPDTVNVEVQERNRSSLLWFIKRILALRSRHLAFGRGTFEPLLPANPAVLAFIRRYENETVLVVANMSRFPQFAELDLRHLDGNLPEEMFGRRPFPKIGELPYLITLGPHTFYWFEIRSADAMRPHDVGDQRLQAPQLAEIDVEGEWGDIAIGAARTPLERALVGYLPTCRWFRSKTLQIQSVEIADAIPLGELLLTVLRVAYAQGDPEEYVLPLRFHVGGEPESAIARLNVHGTDATVEGYLTDGAADEAFGNDLLQIVGRRRKRRGRRYRLEGVPGLALRQQDRWRELPPPKPLDVEQSNTSWRYGDQLVAKLYRRVEGGPSPDLVLSRHLSEKANFANVPRLAGHVTIRPEGGAESTLALFQVWVPNQGSAWELALSQIEELFDLTIARGAGDDQRRGSRLDEVLSLSAELARLLGQRTGQMHAALAQSFGDPEMEAEQFTPFARRSYAQAVRNLAVRNFGILQKQLDGIPEGSARSLAAEVLSLRGVVERRARDIADVPEGGLLIRCHGDYHLGQVLYTGNDFVILDFEGEPGRSLADRRRKRSPLSDVAGMVRSFHYASEYALRREGTGSGKEANGRAALEPISLRWYAATRDAFLSAYLSAVEPIADLLPDAESIDKVLEAFGLEKALYEIGYELNNRPGWVDIPLRGLLAVLRGGEET